MFPCFSVKSARARDVIFVLIVKSARAREIIFVFIFIVSFLVIFYS